MVKVYLPRTPLDLLQRRQEVNEVLEELQEKANQVGGEGSELQAMDILKQVVDSVRLLDDVNLEAQVRWCGQVSALVGGLETVLAHAKKSVLDVDAAHQQVHVLQSLTETELRQFSSQESLGSREELLHKQIQELEDDLKSLQEELKSSQMLHRESLEDNNHLQERFQGLEDELKESQVSMNSLKRAVLRAEGALEEVQSELSQLPYTLRAILDMGYEDAVGTTPETKAVMDMHLQEDISIALKIPKTQVEVLCYTRGIGTMAEVKISPSTNLPVYGHKDPFSCKELAEELQRQVADPKSGIHTGQAGKNIKEIEVHGPIADQTARAFRSTLIDMDGNHARTREELARLQDKLREVNMKHHAAIKEEESIKQQIIQDCESRMAAATTDFRSKLSRATDDLAKQAQKEQEDVLEKQKMEFRAAMEDLRLDSSNRAAMLEDANEKLESELQSVRGKLYALESQDSSSRAERESTEDKLRIIEKANAKTKAVYQQVDDILVPELKGCLTTLRNIESEMDFFHTHSMRALALAQHANGHSLPSSQDAHRSKDVCFPNPHSSSKCTYSPLKCLDLLLSAHLTAFSCASEQTDSASKRI
jgi:chromosome segregation ATPase